MSKVIKPSRKTKREYLKRHGLVLEKIVICENDVYDRAADEVEKHARPFGGIDPLDTFGDKRMHAAARAVRNLKR